VSRRLGATEVLLASSGGKVMPDQDFPIDPIDSRFHRLAAEPPERFPDEDEESEANDDDFADDEDDDEAGNDDQDEEIEEETE
jgi:hypothetical protein